MAIDRRASSRASSLIADRGAVTIDDRRMWIGPTAALARSLVMVALAAFAILVILPAAVAAQAAVAF